jgi:hypothetical protein
MERRRRERRTLLAGAAGKLAGVTRLRQAGPSNACTFSDCEWSFDLFPKYARLFLLLQMVRGLEMNDNTVPLVVELLLRVKKLGACVFATFH